MNAATTRGALLRGSTTDALGDEIEGAVVVPGFADFPISIIERETRDFDPASNTWRTVRKLTGRLSTRIPVQPGDRIRDLRDAKIYAVDAIGGTPRGISGRSSVTLKLRRTGS